MHEIWVDPAFVEMPLSGECTAYAGADSSEHDLLGIGQALSEHSVALPVESPEPCCDGVSVT